MKQIDVSRSTRELSRLLEQNDVLQKELLTAHQINLTRRMTLMTGLSSKQLLHNSALDNYHQMFGDSFDGRTIKAVISERLSAELLLSESELMASICSDNEMDKTIFRESIDSLANREKLTVLKVRHGGYYDGDNQNSENYLIFLPTISTGQPDTVPNWANALWTRLVSDDSSGELSSASYPTDAGGWRTGVMCYANLVSENQLIPEEKSLNALVEQIEEIVSS
jgi:hypothetical protein